MIRQFIQAAFTEQGLTIWPLMALGLFFCLFVGVGFWIFRSGSGEFYRRQAALPLEGGPGPDDGRDPKSGPGSSTENPREEVRHGKRA